MEQKKRKGTYLLLGAVLVSAAGYMIFKWAFLDVTTANDSLPPNVRAQADQEAEQLRARGEPTTPRESAEREGLPPMQRDGE